MADQTNRGGRKTGPLQPDKSEQHRTDNLNRQGQAASRTGRTDSEKRRDQKSNPDDATRQPTDQKR